MLLKDKPTYSGGPAEIRPNRATELSVFYIVDCSRTVHFVERYGRGVFKSRAPREEATN